MDGTKNRWSVVSLDGRPPGGTVERKVRKDHGRDVGPTPTGLETAKTALDRIVIPLDVLDRLAGMAPRSSLIITDEALSSETGKDTDFVVVLSGEPQGGLKIRRRAPAAEFNYMRSRERLPYWRSPAEGPYYTR